MYNFIGNLINSFGILVFNNTILLNDQKYSNNPRLIIEYIALGIKLIIQTFLYSIFIAITIKINIPVIRIFINFMGLFSLNCIFSKSSFMRSFYASFLTYIVVFFCDFLCAFVIMIIYKISDIANQQEFYRTILSNFLVCCFMLIIISIPFIKKNLSMLLNKLGEEKNKLYVFLVIITLFICIILGCMFYLELNLKVTLIFNVILMIVYVLIVALIFKEKNEYLRLETKYSDIIDNLQNYEQIIQQLRMNNHENKNMLLIIRGLVHKNNTEAVEYIDDVLDLHFSDDENILNKTKLIPLGGLQGLIYQKLVFMKNENILYYLNIDKKVNSNLTRKMSNKQNRDVCTIIGIFLDNAIQEVKKCSKKNIGINLYVVNKNLYIDIANNFRGEIDLLRMNEVGFSTKGKERGYGLSIVNNLLIQDNSLENIRSINGDVFVQTLKINLKKNKK